MQKCDGKSLDKAIQVRLLKKKKQKKNKGESCLKFSIEQNQKGGVGG
jgi:hypothetical protein